MMCPIWNAPLAYGSAVVTKMRRGVCWGSIMVLQIRC